MPSGAARVVASELAEVLVEDGDLDLPASAKSDVRDGLIDDRLPQRWPRHSDVLRCLLAGQPDCGTGGTRSGVVRGWPPFPEVDDLICDVHVGSRLRAGYGEPADK